MLGYLFKNIKNKESLFLSILFIKTYLSYFNLLFLKKCMLIKKSKDSLAILTDVVLPGETNALNNLFGGELLARMDRAGSISAQRHSRNIVVTASVNHVVFRKVIPVGSVVTIEAKVSRAFNSSMEVYVDVWIEDRKTGDLTKVNEGIYTFVAVDRLGSPVKVSAIKPETDLETERFEGALRRKQLSLLLSGRMEAKDATELKALFEE
jgi:acyl-CoA hydrolase|tara:strand:+ start:69487 stop:70110 length:624 start_codon:yes stop_codon:yes gene_type:complete